MATPRGLARPGTVLVVEDDEDIRECLCDLLCSESYVAVSCTNGREALEFLRREATPPDLVVCDLEMPLMDGRALVSALKADPVLCEVPVVLISASETVHAEATRLGGFGSLRKPVRIGQVLGLVRAAVGRTDRLASLVPSWHGRRQEEGPREDDRCSDR